MTQRILFQFFLCLTFSICFAMNFKPTGTAERVGAIGSTKGLPEVLRLAFDPGSDFRPIPAPKTGDWLAEHLEAGQSFEDFLKAKPARVDGLRGRLYLQALGEFQKGQSPSLEMLREYGAAFFAMDVEILRPFDIQEARFKTRINSWTGKRQILTTDVLSCLKAGLPNDAFCILAITMEDLYPHPSWNFVFGQASSPDRVGVFSFARYDPGFYGETRGRNHEDVLLRRSCKVLVHEMAHMFGLAHCIYFSCVMNGSNHLQESDARPLYLCPVCLRKLHSSLEFDVVRRYQRLLHFYQEVGFEAEARWTAKRLNKLTGKAN